MTLIFILPVYNEEKIIEKSISILHEYLLKNRITYSKIIIANNGSTDNTEIISKKLEQKYSKIEHCLIPKKGRGFALKYIMINYKAEYYFYMDVDLATDLNEIPKFLTIKEKYDLVIGTRTKKSSMTTRSLSRNILSYTYIIFLKILFSAPFSDYQCGFKLYKNTIIPLLSEIKNNNWFFDTESILISYKKGLKVKEIPITWVESRDEWIGARPSKVKIFKTIYDYIILSFKLKLKFIIKNYKKV